MAKIEAMVKFFKKSKTNKYDRSNFYQQFAPYAKFLLYELVIDNFF